MHTNTHCRYNDLTNTVNISMNTMPLQIYL